MKWNWQLSDWTQFTYDAHKLNALEAEFVFKSGVLLGSLKHINEDDNNQLIVDLICNEALTTSEIEGEFLNRDSLQSSIRRNFNLSTDNRKIPPAEQGIAEMLVDLYRNYAQPLTHEILFKWHAMVTKGRQDLNDVGRYRTHDEPMQVVSGYIHAPKIHFEAPPSNRIPDEMDKFITWYNSSIALPPLTRAGIAHLYFESIHPFEDGNGRVGRAISEKVLSQGLGQATLIALSSAIMHNKKSYYDMLEKSNKTNAITEWLIYFGQTILAAQDHTQATIEFLITKTKMYDKVRGKLNSRQEKVIERMFRAGYEGFKGGLSADNYISITGTSRATATRDLNELVEMGVLTRQGELKGTRYFMDLK